MSSELIASSSLTVRTGDGLASTEPARPAHVEVDASKIGRFVVLRKLGEGGMGVVYAAYDDELERKVAIKLLRTEFSGQQQSVGQARLLREAQAMARLSHPNVAQIYEVGKFASAVFIAMEFVAGHNLREWIERAPRSWQAILGAYIQAGHGLAAAHAAGIVHRDFKPKSECPPQTPPLPPSGRILADGGDLRGTVCRAVPRHAAVLATDWQRLARSRTSR